MLKPIITIIFLLSFALQTFSTALIIADYFTNTAAFAKNCENKAKPQMHCNGKCQMMKKLQQQEQKDQQNSNGKEGSKNGTVLFSQTAFAYIIPALPNLTLAYNSHSNSGNIQKMPRTVFHPPGA